MLTKYRTGAIAATFLVVSQAVGAATDSGFYVGFGSGDARLEPADDVCEATVLEAFAGYAVSIRLSGVVRL
jgi:hypothetical protein